MVKNFPAVQETWVRFPGSGRLPGEGMVTHSSILAWRILCTKEPDRAPIHGVTELDMTVRLTHKQ